MMHEQQLNLFPELNQPLSNALSREGWILENIQKAHELTGDWFWWSDLSSVMTLHPDKGTMWDRGLSSLMSKGGYVQSPIIRKSPIVEHLGRKEHLWLKPLMHCRNKKLHEIVANLKTQIIMARIAITGELKGNVKEVKR